MDVVKFFKFGFVGFLGLLIDFCVTWIFKEKLKFNKYISNSIGFLFGVTNNYFLNKYFTFHNLDQNISSQFFSFVLIALIGLLFSTTIIYVLQKYTTFNFYFCKAISVGIVFFWNFFANSFYTF